MDLSKRKSTFLLGRKFSTYVGKMNCWTVQEAAVGLERAKATLNSKVNKNKSLLTMSQATGTATEVFGMVYSEVFKKFTRINLQIML
jgi:hypothetical protein